MPRSDPAPRSERRSYCHDTATDHPTPRPSHRQHPRRQPEPAGVAVGPADTDEPIAFDPALGPDSTSASGPNRHGTWPALTRLVLQPSAGGVVSAEVLLIHAHRSRDRPSASARRLRTDGKETRTPDPLKRTAAFANLTVSRPFSTSLARQPCRRRTTRPMLAWLLGQGAAPRSQARPCCQAMADGGALSGSPASRSGWSRSSSCSASTKPVASTSSRTIPSPASAALAMSAAAA
jgi:hypothetical protein